MNIIGHEWRQFTMEERMAILIFAVKENRRKWGKVASAKTTVH